MSILEIDISVGPVFGLEKRSPDRTEGPRHLKLSIPNASQVYTVRKLVSELSNHEHLAEMFLDGKARALKGNAIILLNGTHIDLLSGLDTQIRVGDRLVLIPFIDGG
ncbi:MAG: hypothetical protein GTN74_08245 [Proteobacteria bacterium]|nr:hypothetical protein [Pseudomonadota bacterium]